MEDLTGKQLGPYQIVSPLGEGGMAAVYKAYQPSMDRYVALKVLPRHFASDPEFVGRFSQEARVIANLQHPHILPVHDFGEADGYSYLTMRFIEGGTLSDWLKDRQPLPIIKIRSIISQVGAALDYAHAQGVIHRDIKPGNILVDKWDNCLLTDFGLAKMVESTSHLTQTGGILGTPAYMSPEQGLGKTIDSRSDIYSMGVVLYQMAIGRLPYRAETPMAVVIKHIHDPLPPPRRYNPELPEALELVILKALAKNPEDRFATAGDMVKALQSATERPTIAKVTAPPLPDPVTVVGETAEANEKPELSETPLPATEIAPPSKPEPKIQPTIVAEPDVERAPTLSAPKRKKKRKRPALRKRPIFYAGLGLVGLVVIILGLIIAGGAGEDGETDNFPEAESVDDLMAIVDEAYEAGDIERALAAIDQAIELEPRLADLYCQRGYALSDLEEYRAAADSFEECRVLAKEQGEPELQSDALGQGALTQAALAQMETDTPERALAIIDEALMQPDAPAWLICERGEYNMWYDNEAAVADFEDCKAQNPDDDYWPWRSESVINMIYGYEALDNEDYYRAIERFSAWAELNPDDPWAYCALGDAHSGASEYQPALEFYGRCRESANGDVDIQNVAQGGEAHAQARLAQSDGDFPQAMEAYNQAIEFSPDNGWLFCERGVFHEELGAPDEARSDYETCLEMSEENPDMREWAEELLQSLNDANQ